MLRVGQVAYLAGGESDERDNTTPVCRTLPQLIALMHFQIDDCPHRPRGTRVIVTAIAPGFDDPKTSAFGKEIPFTTIRPVNGTWSGVVEVIALQPIIPIGTQLVLSGSSDPTMYPHYSGDPVNADVSLGNPVTVQVLEQHPPSEECDLHIRVLTGRLAGRDGWTCDDGTIRGTKLTSAYLQ